MGLPSKKISKFGPFGLSSAKGNAGRPMGWGFFFSYLGGRSCCITHFCMVHHVMATVQALYSIGRPFVTFDDEPRASSSKLEDNKYEQEAKGRKLRSWNIR